MSQQQSKCSGILVFQQAAQSSFLDLPQYETHCYGINASVPADGVVDLFQHNETRNMAVENPDAEVFTLNCVGSAIYQQGPNVPGGSTPPPFCLGVEFVRYSQALMHHRAAAAAAHPTAHTMQSNSPTSTIAAPAPGDTIFHPNGTTSSAASHSSAQPVAYTQQHSTPGSGNRTQQEATAAIRPTMSAEDDEVELSFFEKVQRTHKDISERLEGKDPLWFAKAFSHRASLNWASMKRTAAEVVTAVKSDLGLYEGDDTK